MSEEQKKQFDYYFKQLVGKAASKKLATEAEACAAYEALSNSQKKELKLFETIGTQLGFSPAKVGQYYRSAYLLCVQRAPLPEDVARMEALTKKLLKGDGKPRKQQQAIFDAIWKEVELKGCNKNAFRAAFDQRFSEWAGIPAKEAPAAE